MNRPEYLEVGNLRGKPFELSPDHALFFCPDHALSPKKGLNRATKHDLGHSSYAPGFNSTFDIIVIARVKQK